MEVKIELGKKFALVVSAMAVAGCTPLTNPQSMPEKPFFGAVPSKAITPADAALECLSNTPAVRRNSSVFSVHVVNDQTQKLATEETGGFVPSDSAGMMVSALAKAGVRQVNRVNTAVSEFEINLAREQVLGDDGPSQVGDTSVPYRPLVKGGVLGSDYVIDGSITQLDFNTYSKGTEASIGGVGAGRRVFALTTGADIRVTNTKTTEIVKAQSYTKQAVGAEVFGSIFRFFNDEELIDVKIGAKDQEGLHFGIRWMLAEASYDIVSDLVQHDGSCDRLLPPATQGLRAAKDIRVAEAAGNNGE